MKNLLNLFVALSLTTTALTQVEPAKGPLESTLPTTYIAPKKDPFRAPIPARPSAEAPRLETVTPWPSYEERESEWFAKRKQARDGGTVEPALSERYLIEELKVMGIYKKSDGSGAIIKTLPSEKTVIFAKVGQRFYNGKITGIVGNQIEFEEETMIGKKLRRGKRVLYYNTGK